MFVSVYVSTHTMVEGREKCFLLIRKNFGIQLYHDGMMSLITILFCMIHVQGRLPYSGNFDRAGITLACIQKSMDICQTWDDNRQF